MYYYEIGILSAFLTLFLNYCIGKPGSEFSPYEIFSFYTVWLAKNRLRSDSVLSTYLEQYRENMARVKSDRERRTLNNDFGKILYDAAEPSFTWERAFGMCPVCFGFWVSLVSGTLMGFKFSEIIGIIVISHITIRVLNKVL